MAEIMATTNVVVPNGPNVALASKLSVEAYDAVEVTVKGNTPKFEVDLPPGGKDRVQFLLITADSFSEQLSYVLDDATGAPVFLLDGPHLLTGKGAVAYFYEQSPKKLIFSNQNAYDAKVQILVGRDATP